MVAATEWCRMCNLYSLARSQDEIRRLFKVETDRTGNLPPLPGIFPNTAAPIARSSASHSPARSGR